MKALRRLLIGCLAVASLLLLAAFCAVASAPLWIDTNTVKKEIAALVFRATGDVVQLDRLRLHMFPSLSVEIDRPRYTAPGEADIVAESAIFEMDAWSLILGRVQPRGIHLTGLQATIHLPPASPGREPISLAAVDRQLRGALVQIAKAVPALRVTADASVVTLHIPDQSPFLLHVLHGHARTSGGLVEAELECASEAWQWLALKFSLKADELAGNGLAEFTGLRVARLRGLLGSAGNWPITEAEIIGRVEWQMKGLSDVRAEAIASSPRVLLQRNNFTHSLDAVVAAAGLETRGAAIGLHLHRLYVSAPHLLLSGNLVRDSSGQHQFDMQASGVDLAALQASAHALAPDIQWISNPPISLRAGTLSALELHGNSEAITGLFDPAVLSGEAAFEGVALDVAKPALKLSAVEGRVTLERGELQAQTISATLGKSALREGNLSMNLLSRPAALQGNAVVALDLAEAFALARTVMTQKDVQRHLDAVTKLEGRALAHIALSGNLQSLRTEVDASELAFVADHRDIPLPVTLSRGRVRYTGDAISISGATGGIGLSSFSDLEASMHLTPPYRFDLTRLTALLSMDELFPIAAARPELRAALAELQTVSGAIALTNVQADGSLQALNALHFRVGASPRSMTIKARRFAPQIVLDGGTVDVSNRHIEVKDLNLVTLDSELRVSGHSEDYRAVEASVNGRVGAKTLDWIYQSAATPRALQVSAPLRLAEATIGWKDSGETDFKGKVNVAGKVDLVIDARRTDRSLKFERVTLKDSTSDAGFGGELAGTVVRAWFKGKLAGETLQRLLVEPALSIGSVDGEFAIDMDLAKPEEMHAKGQLQGVAIATTGALAIPVGIERFALTADGRNITLGESVLSSGENRVELSGRLYHQDKRFVVDADVRADSIVLPKSWENSKPGDETGGPSLSLEQLPVAGRIGVNIGTIEAASIKLSPLVAEARISEAKLDLRITQAALCGITVSGNIGGKLDDLQLSGQLSVRDAAFADSIGCLTKDRVQGSGRMDVDASFTARGSPQALGESIAGRFALTARDGNLQKFDTLNRVFALLNVTEIVRGKRAALNAQGMPYRTLTAKGTLDGQMMHFDEFALNAPTVYLAATGRVDYGGGKMALDVLVAPLQSANAVIDKIPLLGRIFGGTVLALPVQVVGTLNNPIVVPLGPGAVATRMTSIIANTLRLPLDAIKVFSPNADQGVKAQDTDKLQEKNQDLSAPVSR